jgi:hypothetical protein
MDITASNKKLLVVAVIVGAGLIIGAAWAMTRTLGHGPRTVEQAFIALAEADTLHASTELALNLPQRFRGRTRPLTKVNIAVAGDVARSENGTPELTGTLKGEALGRGNTFFFDGAVSILQDNVAFNLTEFPTLLNPSGSLSNRWTYVPVPLLATNNGSVIKDLLAAVAAQSRYQGRSTVAGVKTLHYSVSVAPEQEDALAAAFAMSASGNRALHTLARLLRANNIDAFDLYINSSSLELTQAKIHFVRPLEGGKTFDFAELTLAFTDYGKPVTIDHPPQQAHVRPEVFGALFGTGEVQALQQ